MIGDSLYRLADKINRHTFEQAFSSLYCPDNGRPAKPVRLMCGLLILKHLRNLSDEPVVEQWSENTCYQYFCGCREFTPSFPCNATDPVHFRHRIGEKGIELIFGESIRVNVGYTSQTGLFNRALSQGRNNKDKIYSLHEPEVVCISKDREHKKYESGNKVSVITSIRGVILGALSFRNECDGHTVDRALEQVKRITGMMPALSACDRGYRGQKQSGDTGIEIPETPKLRDIRCQKQKKRKLFCKRAGIEAGIGPLKSDHRLGRNFYRGLQGDAINIMLAAAAINFKRAMRLLWCLIKKNKQNTA